MAMVAEWAVWASVILDYQTAIVWSLLPWLERSTHCWSSLFSRPREAALPSHVWSGVLEALATRLDFGSRAGSTRLTLQDEVVGTILRHSCTESA